MNLDTFTKEFDAHRQLAKVTAVAKVVQQHPQTTLAQVLTIAEKHNLSAVIKAGHLMGTAPAESKPRVKTHSNTEVVKHISGIQVGQVWIDKSKGREARQGKLDSIHDGVVTFIWNTGKATQVALSQVKKRYALKA